MVIPTQGKDKAHISAENPVRVLLIDDEADTLLPILAQHLKPNEFHFLKESNQARALQSVASIHPDVILLDLHFPGDDRNVERTTGGKLLTDIRRRFVSTPVIVFSTRLDDFDIPEETFDEKPHWRFAKPKFDRSDKWAAALAQAMREAIDMARSDSNPDVYDLGFLVGQTQEMREVVRQIRAASRNTLSVLIYGETGSGKLAVAEAIHKLSDRKEKPFKQLNCGGIHEETLDGLLFGHEKGGYTGAHQSKPGLFEIANGGSVFLDEFQSIPISLQNKLMLVVESRVVQAIGATQDKKVDVRLIVATNRNLSTLVADGLVREDLAYRIVQMPPISLPPLRQRKADLPELFRIFVAKANQVCHKSMSDILRPETLRKLQDYDWPGNIRELENTIKGAVANATSNILFPGDIVFTGLCSSSELTVEPETPGVSDAPPTAAGLSGSGSGDSLAKVFTDQLESLPIEQRYPFLSSQKDPDLRKAILIEFIGRLRRQTGQKVSHELLAGKLVQLPDKKIEPLEREKVLARIRQFAKSSKVKLKELECNQ